MKLKFLFLSVLLLGLAGCADKAVVALTDGSEVLVKDHADFDKYHDYYEFEQLDGQTILIKKDNVRYIKSE
ncbi:YgdI/YgdR family lipoprotein [Pseudomonas citronellolis]|uniref:YgdI/YgdR family lipoprotein n=1 Tax=Pseudomonas citronellolis TaxID=53408 RepID=UPI0023E4705C|nr:YgdI/YgdR family lipoprotein [Pseudomonas citronellolis]MDF3936468.1 YgdI/YgdR family lipoprotein [Pseudomonas citronellolis]